MSNQDSRMLVAFLLLNLFVSSLQNNVTVSEEAPALYTTREGCESLLKSNNECECQDKRIKCGMVTLSSSSQLYSISCSIFDVRGFGYLPPLKAGSIGRLSIDNCAIPNAQTIRSLLSKLGVSNYTELEVSNYFETRDERDELLEQHFTNYPGLKKISLIGFKAMLPANFFENVTEITELTLKGRSDLPGTLLHPLTHLTRLSIVVRNMASVASEIFAKQTELLQLSLDCSLKNSSVDMSLLSSKELWHMTKLRGFELHNCGDNVPAELFWKSENLSYIGIRSNISYLGRDFLKSQRQLLMLHLERNNIARLPDELFHHSPMLLEIHLAHNNLDRIQGGLFNKLKNLLVLNLEHNPITTVASNAFTAVASARIYIGDLFKQLNNADWARSTNATLCEEEYINGVCLYCKRDEYLDHFSAKEICNKPNDPGKLIEVLNRKVFEHRLHRLHMS
ncbi:leucine-rich repeat-containing protein 15 [Drosophila novamexicana]|uniref:leucine-rich repeat-containing protein 15 n=1 Tax=Drosophila novamexicana TaxID=47314 RepID=UPI0011E5DC1A|nr:leucine-rich repeat-containing protein 15 [Drosophila novamexicana]XP_030557214.1 leucine-rich repeat-containing protein 15 [Drosophila novamexicana]